MFKVHDIKYMMSVTLGSIFRNNGNFGVFLGCWNNGMTTVVYHQNRVSGTVTMTNSNFYLYLHTNVLFSIL